MKNIKTVLIVAHGSKRQKSNDEFINLIKDLKDDNLSIDISYAFLEFKQPDINSSIKNLIQNGYKQIYIYPYFLNAGKHVQVDIPKEVELVKKDYPKIDIEILSHFGSSQNIQQVIKKDLETI